MSRLVHRVDDTSGESSPGVWGRAGLNPVRARCRVLRNTRTGAYTRLELAAPAIAARAHPGQFLEVAVEAPGTVLRRPFSIAGVDPPGRGAGTVEIVCDPHGAGTTWLATLQPSAFVDAVGPLGSRFGEPSTKVPCLLVGGGYGAAPLFYLAESLTARGLRVDMIVGAATRDRLFEVIEARRITASATFTTEDGSYGTRGRVTDVFGGVITSAGSGMVYACGPMPMLRAVSLVAAAADLPCQVAVEEHMACGVGVCWTCVIPVETVDGEVHNRRSCIDGPVLDGSRIAWNRTRWAVDNSVR